MTYARIAGTGSYAPAKVITNADLSRMLGEDIDEFVSQVLGIRERHVCAADESTADLATEAARRALTAAARTTAPAPSAKMVAVFFSVQSRYLLMA